MPLRYVNPAPKRRTRRSRVKMYVPARTRSAAASRLRRARTSALIEVMAAKGRFSRATTRRRKPARITRRKLAGAALVAHLRKAAKRSRKNPITKRRRRRANPTTKRKTMAKKLYGAAAAAHAKKLGKRKRRKGSSRKRRSARRPSHKRSLAAKKAARTRKRRAAARRSGHGMFSTGFAKRVARKAYARRKRRASAARRAARAGAPARYLPGIKMNPSRRRRRRRRHHARMNPAPRRRRRRVHHRAHAVRRRRNPRPSTQRSLLRARRAIRNRYMTPLGRATRRRYRMRSNPSSIMAVVKEIVPVAVTLFGARILSGKLAGRIPGLNRLPSQFQGPAVAVAIMGVAHFATQKIGALRKHRTAALIGAGLNLADALFASFAPASVKGMLGVGDYVAQGDYIQMGMGDYVSINGAPPINDDITLSGFEQDLGVEEELGMEEDLGADTNPLDRAWLGGVGRNSLMAPVPRQPLLAAIPDRSFTRVVPDAGSSYDNRDRIYTGIFASD